MKYQTAVEVKNLVITLTWSKSAPSKEAAKSRSITTLLVSDKLFPGVDLIWSKRSNSAALLKN